MASRKSILGFLEIALIALLLQNLTSRALVIALVVRPSPPCCPIGQFERATPSSSDVRRVAVREHQGLAACSGQPFAQMNAAYDVGGCRDNWSALRDEPMKSRSTKDQ
jgi:hypothetical protein